VLTPKISLKTIEVSLSFKVQNINYLLSLGSALIIPTIRVVIIKYCSFPMLIIERNTESENKFNYVYYHIRQHDAYKYYSHF